MSPNDAFIDKTPEKSISIVYQEEMSRIKKPDIQTVIKENALYKETPTKSPKQPHQSRIAASASERSKSCDFNLITSKVQHDTRYLYGVNTNLPTNGLQ